MGFLDQYQDRGPTLREVFEVQRRVRDAMVYDVRRKAGPEYTVFTAPWHVGALRLALAAADPACVVLDLSGRDVLNLPAYVLSGLVFALNAETREPMCISLEHLPDLVGAVAAGEAPTSAVGRLAGEYVGAVGGGDD